MFRIFERDFLETRFLKLVGVITKDLFNEIGYNFFCLFIIIFLKHPRGVFWEIMFRKKVCPLERSKNQHFLLTFFSINYHFCKNKYFCKNSSWMLNYIYVQYESYWIPCHGLTRSCLPIKLIFSPRFYIWKICFLSNFQPSRSSRSQVIPKRSFLDFFDFFKIFIFFFK